jgi:tRNA threonylcarbamoyl adenosine modification protein YeaZ
MELAIDSVGMTSSVAISDHGRALAEITWPTGRRHTPALIPMIDAIVRAAQIDRSALQAIAVDTGPGAYGGIRAGMATAGALALVLGLPAVGVGRLEIEAYPHAAASSGAPIAAVHRAGRGQWALALYRGAGHRWREELPPALCSRSELVDKLRALPDAGLLCGEAELLGDAALAQLAACDDAQPAPDAWTVVAGAANLRRAAVLGEIAWQRLQTAPEPSRTFHPAQLEPIYLRPPAIGPQPPVSDDE